MPVALAFKPENGLAQGILCTYPAGDSISGPTSSKLGGVSFCANPHFMGTFARVDKGLQ